MQHDTAGDPMSGLKWTQKTTDKIALELQRAGINVGPKAVARLLKQMGYSLRVNHKKLARVCATSPADRDAQFVHIPALRRAFAAPPPPVPSVDPEPIDLTRQLQPPRLPRRLPPLPLHAHDFRSEADGVAIPYGIYDLQANHGTLYVGTSRATAAFAVDAIEAWWIDDARQRYPHATELAILADGGGSNGSRCRAWKHRLQQQLAERHGLSVTVAHYPPGASKWNPIEHRLFSEISKNWAGRPLDSYETALNCIGTTTTKTGLTVRAQLLDRLYEKDAKIADAQMHDLPISNHDSLPKWNYTLSPRPD